MSFLIAYLAVVTFFHFVVSFFEGRTVTRQEKKLEKDLIAMAEERKKENEIKKQREIHMAEFSRRMDAERKQELIDIRDRLEEMQRTKKLIEDEKAKERYIKERGDN